ncbi:MAG: rod shape-determining protein MreC [Pseudomonadota bacterium]|nr:rod shape-determining protein MreC [Pseudomonadota bacterium]
MLRIKFWLLLFSIILILLDKFSFISTMRDFLAVYAHRQIATIKYRVTSYPKWVFLQKSAQQQLETENSQLRRQIEQDAILIKQQNNRGYDMLEVESLRSHPGLYDDFKVTMARGIIDVNYLINNKLLIDQGAKSGIAVGDTVVNKEGVIGQLGIVNPDNAQIMLITNPEYKVYVQNSVSKSKMLIQGAGNNKLTVKYMNKSDKTKVGDVLVTTGLDDLYPANIPVAKVTKVFYENNGFNTALCEPAVNFNRLQYVLVLKNATE